MYLPSPDLPAWNAHEGRTCFVWGRGGWAGGAQECRLPPLSAAFPRVGAPASCLVLFFSLCFPQCSGAVNGAGCLGAGRARRLVRGTEDARPGVWGFGRKRKGSWVSAAHVPWISCVLRTLPARSCLSCLGCQRGATSPGLARKKLGSAVVGFSWCPAQPSPEERAAILRVVLVEPLGLSPARPVSSAILQSRRVA